MLAVIAKIPVYSVPISLVFILFILVIDYFSLPYTTFTVLYQYVIYFVSGTIGTVFLGRLQQSEANRAFYDAIERRLQLPTFLFAALLLFSQFLPLAGFWPEGEHLTSTVQVSRSGTVLHCKLPNHPNCWSPVYSIPSLPRGFVFNAGNNSIDGKIEFSPSLQDYISVPVYVKCRAGPSYNFELDFDLNIYREAEENRRVQEENRRVQEENQEENRRAQEENRKALKDLEAKLSSLYEKVELNTLSPQESKGIVDIINAIKKIHKDNQLMQEVEEPKEEGEENSDSLNEFELPSASIIGFMDSFKTIRTCSVDEPELWNPTILSETFLKRLFMLNLAVMFLSFWFPLQVVNVDKEAVVEGKPKRKEIKQTAKLQ